MPAWKARCSSTTLRAKSFTPRAPASPAAYSPARRETSEPSVATSTPPVLHGLRVPCVRNFGPLKPGAVRGDEDRPPRLAQDPVQCFPNYHTFCPAQDFRAEAQEGRLLLFGLDAENGLRHLADGWPHPRP